MDDVPPPLPPNRPKHRGRTTAPYTFNQPRSHPAPPPVPQARSPPAVLSPRHSWAPGTIPNLESSPPFQPELSPPPVPSSSRPAFNTSFSASLTSSISSGVTLFPHPDDKFSLTELVDNYSSLFPVKVCVVKGFYGDRGENSAIAVDEMYNFHFVKRSKVVSITDLGKNKYVIPLNSATKFGLLYEEGTVEFGSVEDVLSAKILPRVICAKASYVGNNENSSVARHEVLIVTGVEKGRFRRKAGSLKVYSVTKSIEKTLSKDVFGKFTTDPFCTQMYLPEFVKYIKDPIPCKAKLYLDFESEEPLPDFLTSEAIDMKRLYVETSVIASPLNDDGTVQETDSDEGSSCTVDIPISLDIEVSVIPPADEEDDDYEKLTEETMTLLRHFDPSSAATRHVDMDQEREDDYSYTAQNQLFKNVRKGFEKEGLNIETPKKVRSFSQKMTVPLPRQRSVGSPDSQLDQEGYEDMTQLGLQRPDPDYPLTSRDSPPPPPPNHPNLAPRNAPPTPPPYHPRDSPPPPPPPNHPSTVGLAPAPALPTKPKSKTSLQHTPSNFPANKTATIPPKTKLKPRPSSASSKLERPQIPGRKPFDREPSPLPPNDDDLYVDEITTHEVSNKPVDTGTQPVAAGSGSPISYLRPKRTSRPIPPIPEAPPPHSEAPPTAENDSDLSDVQTSLSALSARVECLEDGLGDTLTHDDLSTMSAELKGILPKLEENVKLTRRLQGEMATMQEDMKRLRQELQASKVGKVGGGAGGSPSTSHKNKELEELDISQIQKVLELMGMSKYQKTFLEAEIDGNILVQCDDKVLQEDLEVSSKLDRLKLVQMIQGRKSVRSILQKAYVTFEPRS